jgi:serine/threonine protein kinase
MDPYLQNHNEGQNFFPSKKSDVYSVGVMMVETYYYTSENDKGIKEPVKRYGNRWTPFYRLYYDSNENFESIKPNNNSNDHSPLKTLLKHMIDRDPDKRFTVEQVLDDMWFTYTGGKRSRKLKKRKSVKKRRQSSFVKSRRSSRR